jgi:hypothetical protein
MYIKMTEQSHSIRIRRSYVTILIFLVLFLVSAFGLINTIQARGAVTLVFMLAVATLAFFFLTLLCFFSPYLRVDDDRIIIHHDLLRKDVLFFYDLNRIEFEPGQSIALYHLNGLTRVVFRKFNATDRAEVLAFFKKLEMEK